MVIFGARVLATGLALGMAIIAVAVSAQQGDLERARRLLAEARDVAGKISNEWPGGMLSEVAGMQARAGDRQAALATAAEAKNLGWHAVVEGFADAGDVDSALDAAGRLVVESAPIVRRGPNADPYVTDAVHNALATGQAEAGDSEAALRTIALVKDWPPPREMWRALGVAAGRRGHVDRVLAHAPDEEGRRAALLLGLAEGLLARAGVTRQP